MSNEQRLQQIRNAARYKYPDERIHFIDGAKWADSHPAWVSVEDEPFPPKKNKWDKRSEEVFVYCLWCGKPTMAFGEYYYDIHEWGLKGLMPDVTHWMPLPTPPVKKGGSDEND